MSDLHALRAGTVVAGYDIVRVLGSGGFGITYEAVSSITGKRVAIKEFFPRGIASRDSATKIVFDHTEGDLVAWALKRFESSTTDQCRLRHPNIVEVLHYVKDNGTGYMIMEYVEGKTLEQWLRSLKQPPSPEELRNYIAPVFSALDYLHAENLIHRDIAPDNIMVKPNGNPMIIDFGAIKMIERQTQVRSKTNRSFLVSKQFYSPPEQIQDGGELDARADIYATGAVIYRALSGKPPVNAEERTQKIAFGKGDPYVPLSQAGVNIPPRVAAAVDRAMAFRAEERPASVREFSDDLGWSGDTNDAETVPASPQARQQQRFTTKPALEARESGLTQAKAASSGRRVFAAIGILVCFAVLLSAFELNPFASKPDAVSPIDVATDAAKVPPEGEALKQPPSPPAVQPDSALVLKAYEAALAKNDRQSLEQFVAAHPQSPLVSAARTQIEQYQRGELLRLISDINEELERVGCGQDLPDENWSTASSGALDNFNKYAKRKVAVTTTPSAEALALLQENKSRVCPLVCPAGQQARGESCVAVQAPVAAPQRQQPQRQQNNAEPPIRCKNGRCGHFVQRPIPGRNCIPNPPGSGYAYRCPIR